MTRLEAVAFSLRNPVVIPVRNLRDLRSTLDVLLSSFSNDCTAFCRSAYLAPAYRFRTSRGHIRTLCLGAKKCGAEVPG
jgi:hypothetical protein